MARTKGKAEFVRWIPLVLDGLRALGGSAETRAVIDWIANAVNLSHEEREQRNANGIIRFENQVYWARQYLVWEGLLDSSRRGIWTLTPTGVKARLTEEQSRELAKRQAKLRSKKDPKTPNRTNQDSKPEGETGDEAAEVVSPELVEESELLEVLQSLSPEGFERLCKRLLHEYGLEKVFVTGKSHDGGIDGMGLLRLNTFVTMKVHFPMQEGSKGSQPCSGR